MPIYEYQCSKCGKLSTKTFLSSINAPLTIWMECCKQPANRIMSIIGGFKFKGTGFYTTDYQRSDEYKRQEKKEEKK